MNRIYFVSDTGAAFGDPPSNERHKKLFMAKLAELGYRECTREEYLAKRAWQRREEQKEADAEHDETLRMRH